MKCSTYEVQSWDSTYSSVLGGRWVTLKVFLDPLSANTYIRSLSKGYEYRLLTRSEE